MKVKWNKNEKPRESETVVREGKTYAKSLANAWWLIENGKPVLRVQATVGADIRAEEEENQA